MISSRASRFDISRRPIIARIVRALLRRLRLIRSQMQRPDLGAAFAQWFKAAGDLEDAKERGDRRAQHVAEQDLRRAMTHRLAVELGR